MYNTQPVGPCLGPYQGRVFVDIMNEPDSVGVRWEPTASNGSPGTPNPGITQLYLRTMDALWDMTPDAVIFFVEGGGQGNLQGVNWGNGFATDRSLVRSLGLSGVDPVGQDQGPQLRD